MCLVEVEKAPKLAPSCATSVAEGQVVHVHSDEGARGAQGRARDAAHQPPARLPDLRSGGRVRAAGLHVSRKAAPKAATASRSASIRSRTSAATSCTSPNRCILCTRCVRFMDDVAHDPVLNVSRARRPRADRQVRGEGPHAPWAGNVIDLCPVGALLSKDFLNKARAWELDRSASVCPNCSQGCNMIVETRDNQVVRLRPRPNEEVNKFFMCDHGRLNYRWMNRQDRVDVAAGARRAACSPRPTGKSRCARPRSCSRASARSCSRRRMLSNEALFLLGQLVAARRRRAVRSACRRATKRRCPASRISRCARDRAANGRGAELLGFTRSDTPLDGLGSGRRADRRRRGARRQLDAADVAKAARGDRDRHDAARVGARMPRTSCCRSRTVAEEEGHVHEPARPRAALPAGEGGAGHRAAELASCSAICSRALGERIGLLDCRSDVSTRSRQPSRRSPG